MSVFVICGKRHDMSDQGVRRDLFKIDGLDELAQRVPAVREGRGWLIGLFVLTSFGAATAAMLVIDRLWPLWTGAGQVAVILLSFAWTGQFFWRRKEYRARWGRLAYGRAFGRHVLIGLPMILAALAHTGYLPGDRLPLGPATPAIAVAGGYFLATGLVLWGRAVLACGLDTLAMLYVYFPDEGRLVDTSIYRLIRHPIYSAVIRITLALGLLRGTWFSILFGLFAPLGLTLWVRLVEEPELIERFGEGYETYRRETPAFWPRPRNVGSFFRFLLTGQ